MLLAKVPYADENSCRQFELYQLIFFASQEGFILQ